MEPAYSIGPPGYKRIVRADTYQKQPKASFSRTVQNVVQDHPPAHWGKTTETLRTKCLKSKNNTDYIYRAPQPSAAVSEKDKPVSVKYSNSLHEHSMFGSVDPEKATFIKYTRKVVVTSVVSPVHFYLQNVGFEMNAGKLCRDDAEDSPIPEEVAIGSVHLAQSQSDRRWYRCRVLGKTFRNKKFLVQFVDYGHMERVLHSRLRVLPDEMKLVKDGALKCALYDIVPADGSKDWAPECQQIIVDFVRNKLTLMYIIEGDTDVDLIVQTVDGPKSLRESLIYMNLAKRDPNALKRSDDSFHRINHLEKAKKRWIMDYQRSFPARHLQKDDVFQTKIVSSVSPYEFYICRSEWLETYRKMKLELEDYCINDDASVAYSPHVGMVCVFAQKDCDDLMVWKRGRVLTVGRGSCKLDSVDTGHRVTVSWKDIREIPQQFCLHPVLSVRCCLMHIQPFMEDFYQWTEEASAYFNRIARTSFAFRVVVGEQEANTYGVALYLVKRRHDICVNGLMVKSKYAMSIGVESTVVVKEKQVQEEKENNSTKHTAEKRVSRRVQVELLRVISPNEFYVSLISNDYRITRLQEFIQDNMHATSDEGDDKISWQQGELCLVFPTTATRKASDTLDSEWYRARVVEVAADSTYRVFLIDKALTITSHYSKMRPIALKFLQEFFPFAIRCSLTCIGPTGRMVTWSPSVVDAFVVAIEKFKFFSISIHGWGVDQTFHVILWGMTVDRSNALSSQLYTYTNVNNKLVQYGYAHLVEKFPPVAAALVVEEVLESRYQALDDFLDQPDAGTEDTTNIPSNVVGSIDDYQNDITDELAPIDHWLPGKPIDKALFIGIPTYVDTSGVIYLHDAGLERTFSAIREAINGKFTGSQQQPGDQFYSIGGLCLAKYHQDEQFYRAVVRKPISHCRYEVQMVDYGIIEVCHVRDLRKSVICGRIPTLASKYRLTGVFPKLTDRVWPLVTLDALRALIVDKQCQIQVDTDMDSDTEGVIPCYIKTTGEFPVDAAEFLLNTFDQLYDPFADLVQNLNDSSTLAPSKFELSCDDNMQSYFNEKELTDLLEAIGATAERREDDEGISGDGSGIDLNQAQYFYNYGDIKLNGNEVAADVSTNFSFNSNEFDTSTRIEQPLDTARLAFGGFPNLTVDKFIHGFYCEVTNLLDPFNMFVCPQLDDHIRLMKDTMAQIQYYAQRHGPCPEVRLQMSCLAKFKEDGFWYRALVVKHFPERAEARVLYVDYLNEETIDVRDIVKCPSSLRNVPLRNVQIKLHALRLNPRWRQADVLMKLVELVEGRNLYARVVAHSPALEVELFGNSECDRLVYHQLVEEKYFWPTN